MASGSAELAEEFHEQGKLVAGWNTDNRTARQADFKRGGRRFGRCGDFGEQECRAIRRRG